MIYISRWNLMSYSEKEQKKKGRKYYKLKKKSLDGPIGLEQPKNKHQRVS